MTAVEASPSTSRFTKHVPGLRLLLAYQRGWAAGRPRRRARARRDPRAAGHGLRRAGGAARRSPGSTRPSPASSATRCSGRRASSCSDPTRRSRR